MLRVTVELIPFGIGEPETIGIAYISNDGTGGPLLGHYNAKFEGKRHGRIWKQTRVENFHRARLGPWDLLYRALHGVIGERNIPA